MNPNEQHPDPAQQGEPAKDNRATVTHNLDTGQDEPLDKDPSDDEGMMDFASGSGGGSGGDGAAA